MRSIFAEILVKTLFFLEKLDIELISIPKITPNKKTQTTFSLLRKIYTKAEKENIKIWLTGSWAITGRNGNYFKNIDDIDFTMRTRKDEEKFSVFLKEMGLRRIEKNRMGANRFINPKTNTHIDFGSITYPGTIYYKMNLNEKETVELDGFNFRVIPVDRQIDLYKHLLFRKGRSVLKDLQKLKILYLANRKKK